MSTTAEIVLAPEAEHAIANQQTIAGMIAEEAARIIVTDAGTAQIAADWDAKAAAAHKTIEAERVSWVRPLNDQVARFNGHFKPLLEQIETARRLIRHKVVAWHEAERKRAEEAQRLKNEKAEQERRRQEALAAENLRKAEEARAAGDAAKAEKYEAKAEAQEEKAATVPVYTVAAPTAPAGMSTSRAWKATCTDIEALLLCAVTDPDLTRRAIARGMLKVEFSQQGGNRQAQATKTLVQIPGVVFAQETSVRQRGA